MAAITVSEKLSARKGGLIHTYYGTGTSNQADTLTSTAVPEHKSQRLAYVTCVYSAAATQAGVTVTLDSGLGSTYDALLTTGTANAQTTTYIPDGDVMLLSGDAIVVAAPAGGAVTAAIAIVTVEV